MINVNVILYKTVDGIMITISQLRILNCETKTLHEPGIVQSMV